LTVDEIKVEAEDCLVVKLSYEDERSVDSNTDKSHIQVKGIKEEISDGDEDMKCFDVYVDCSAMLETKLETEPTDEAAKYSN